MLPSRAIRLALLAALALLCAGAGPTPLAPRRHGGFDHYTFALTWQPGFCLPHPCAKDQPHVGLGLHGLWASRPPALVRQGKPPPYWWAHGCDVFHKSDAPPPIPAKLRRAVLHVMPHLPRSLLTHEYDKHVQCFGFDAARFFETELKLRRQVARSAFGRHLAHLAGHRVRRQELVEAFQRAFHTPHPNAIQLRCEPDPAPGHGKVLTQLWLTIPAAKLAAFPRPEALMDARQHQDDCPATFRVPAWPR